MKTGTRRKMANVLLLGLIFLPTVLLARQAESNVIMQGFYWNTHPGDITSNQGVWWDSLATVANELAGVGFRSVWTPPPTKGFAGVHDMGYGTYDYFDLGELNQKGTVRTRHGNRAQLEAMMAVLHNAGLKVMADVVLNHRGGAEAQQLEDCDDGDGRQLRFTKFRPLSGRLPADSAHFHPNSFPGHCDLNFPFHNRIFFEDVCYFNFIDNVLDPNAANNGWFFGPHNLGAMGDSLVVWGRFLMQNLGFDEVRLDAVKHIEPGFLAPFLVELANGNQPFAVGEFFDGDLGALKFYHDEVERFVSTFGTGAKDANFALFDFNLRYALRDVANNTGGGFDMWNLNFRGLRLNPGGALDAEDIVTFVDNHDTDRIGYRVVPCPGGIQFGNTCLEIFTDSGHDPVIFDKHIAYAYIMAAEGRPTVFWKDWYWYNLDDEIKWQMALRRATATGSTTPVKDLNPFSSQGIIGDDLFALRRNGSGSGKDGAMLMLNDDPGTSFEFFLDSPGGWQNSEARDYSDAFLFQSTQVFADGRALYESPPRNYAWYAPTGLYPQPPSEPPSAFTLGDHVGAKLHYVVLRAAEVNQFIINGIPIQPGDEIAILHTTGTEAVGLGRIGQSFRWDGVHDMIIEVLGGSNAPEAKGGLLNGDPLRLAVFDQSAQTMTIAANVSFAPSGTNFSFSAKRPVSRGGSAPFNLTTNNGNGVYQVGGISLVTAFEINLPDIANTVVFAKNSVWLKENANILSGNVLVNDASPGPVLDSQVELSVGQGVDTPAGFVLKANRLKVKQGAVVASEVHYNEITNNGTITGALHTPLALPVLSALPPFSSSPAGTQDIEVAQEGFMSLDAGDYGDIFVRAKGKLLFTGGIYNLRSLDTGDHAQLLFAAPSEVRVADKFDTDSKVYIGPQEGADVFASDIIFYIAGINGNNGNLGATPKAAQIGITNTVLANFYVPNGTLWIRENTIATGAFWGKNVIVGIGADLALESFFANSGAQFPKAHHPENHNDGEKPSIASAQPQTPEHFALEQNYPNPFLSGAKSPALSGGNPETEIRFQLPEASHVVVKIFNTLGKEIRTLVNASYQPGYHNVRWDGKDENGNPVASGVYFYQLQAGNFSQMKKMSLLR
jgi:alpha-amylase